MLEWVAATVAVVALILLLARGSAWVLRRSTAQRGPVRQVGAWKVATDANVRAIRVFDRVHLLYERGRESVLLDSVQADRFAPVQPRQAVAELHPVHARDTARVPRERVATA